MKAALLEFLRERHPATYLALRRLVRRPGSYDLLCRRLGDRFRWRVAAGPFAGMRYVRESWGSSLAPKLVGSYEAELHGWIAELVAQRPSLVVDVGCAEGWYAVGLARAIPTARVVAFDLDSTARALCRRAVRLNGVADRVDVRRGCSREQFAALDLAGALVVMDCEGCELQLLDPAAAPSLARATILVELHDCFVPGLTPTLLARFEATHAVAMRDVAPRDPDAFDVPADLAPADRTLAVDEHRIVDGERVRQQWALLRPRSARS